MCMCVCARAWEGLRGGCPHHVPLLWLHSAQVMSVPLLGPRHSSAGWVRTCPMGQLGMREHLCKELFCGQSLSLGSW